MLTFDIRSADDIVVVTPRGVLNLSTSGLLRSHLAKIVAEHPKTMIVDLAELHLQSDTVATVFVTAHAELAEWPGVPLVLAAPTSRTAELLTRQRAHRYLPVRPTVADAIATIGDPPPRLVDRVLLPNDPESPAVARLFARDSCVLWGHPKLGEDAAMLLGELVANAVTHTRSMVRVRVELRRGLLSVAVYDDDPTTPLPRKDASGLAMVARTAAAWGCSPTPLPGKVVWATLRIDGSASRNQPSRDRSD